MSERRVLNATPRTVLGKKVKNLRKAGLLPGNVFGRALESTAIQTDAREFGRLMTTDSIRRLFDLKVEGEKKPRHVILRGLERRGGTGEPIHVDLLQVDLRRSVWITVPLNFTGVAPAVRDLAGTLVHSQSTLRIRCRPGDIPIAIDVDLSVLDTFSATITVGTLPVPKGVEILTDPELVVATVVPPRVAETVAIEGEEEEEEGAEGETAEGEDGSAQDESED